MAFIGDYVPRKCGIATFTYDVREAVAKQFPHTESFIVPVNDLSEGYEYPPEVRFEFMEGELESYLRAADYINFGHVDVVSLQHEFGIYGGPAGSFILPLMRDLRVPVVTTLHTVLQKPNADQRLVMKELTALSARLVVMGEKGKTMLTEIYSVPEEKIDVIPHGIPDMPFIDPNFYKDQFGVEGKHVLLTFGLLSPNKGIEVALRTLPKIVKEFPDLVYIILGATHPNLVRQHGESYRQSLERMAQSLGVERHVSFYNRFVNIEELKSFLGVADIYITPYLNAAQITSGTLAYAVGCGKAVVSTPYWHAEELLAEDRGVLVPFGDTDALAREVIGLLRDDQRRHAMRKRAYMFGRNMIWSQTAGLYMASFEKARSSRVHAAPQRLHVRTLEQEPLELPRMNLSHLIQMSDATGMLQHATYTFRNFSEGYCTDDNARALILCVLLEELELEVPELKRLSKSYASFLNYAFDRDQRRFRNFMSFDRRWLEDVGSTDSQARALWCLGTCVGRSSHRDLQYWAADLFDKALPNLLEASSIRTWAFTLLGIYEYFRRFNGDRFVAAARDNLTARILDQYDQHAGDNWLWFEDKVTYANARIPQVLILGGRWADNPRAYDVGLKSLRWLLNVQTSEAGHFRPIGSNGWYPRGEKPAAFDQQPIEAHGTVSACLEAYRTTNDNFWYEKARRAFEWFLGRNDLGLSLHDPATGGCCDGLHVDRINLNQGAESTLAFLIAQAEMLLLENDLKAFMKPREREIQPYDESAPPAKETKK